MSSFTCPTCGLISYDCGKAGFKTKREMELEEEVAAGLRREKIHLNRAFRAEKKLEIAVKALEKYANTPTYDWIDSQKAAQEALAKIKEIKG